MYNEKDKYIPDGTISVWGLFPCVSNYNVIDAMQNNQVRGLFMIDTNATIEDIKNNNFNSYEEFNPDGILKIKTSHNIDVQVRNTIQNEIDSNQGYRGVSRNCSTFVRDVLKVATGKEINGEENWLYYNYVTPNKLYKETKELPNVDELLNPGDRINYDFINILNIFK